MVKNILLLAIFTLTIHSYASASNLKLDRVNIYKSETGCKATEIVSIQESSKRLALSCGEKGLVDILSIEQPSKPSLLNSFNISKQEEISSIAFHPSENIIAAAVLNNDPFANGSIQFHDADSGEIINTLEAGVHTDGLAFSPNGKYLVVANEGEAYHYNGKDYESPDGSVTLINFSSSNDAHAIQIKLSDYSDVKGMLQKNMRANLKESSLVEIVKKR